MVEVIFIFGLTIGFIIGVFMGAGIDSKSNRYNRSSYSSSRKDYVRNYMNNPIVEELNNQERNKYL